MINALSSYWLILWSIATVICLSWNEGHHLNEALISPRWINYPIFGTDPFGRDLLLLTLKGAFKSMSMAIVATAVIFPISVSLGLIIAIANEGAKQIAKAILDFFISFPAFILALAFVAIIGTGWHTLIASLFLFMLPNAVRLNLVKTESLLKEDYILAASAMGASRFDISLRHLAPQVLQFALIKLPNLFSRLLIAEAALSFMGIGAPLGETTWGMLLSQSRHYLIEAPYMAFFTGLPLFITVFSFQQISENLEFRFIRNH